jgi:hypothetical protein
MSDQGDDYWLKYKGVQMNSGACKTRLEMHEAHIDSLKDENSRQDGQIKDLSDKVHEASQKVFDV